MDANEEGTDDILLPSSDASYRPLAVLFWDIVGSCDLLSKLPLEVFRKVIRNAQDTATDAIHAHGGFVAQYLGDGILAYFGYPRTLEDDTERAVRASLAIIAALAKHPVSVSNQSIQCRIAIAAGPVIVDPLTGTLTARGFPAFGTAPNLAARLLSVTPKGSIVVADNVRCALGDLFAFESITDLSLKGFPQVRLAWRVLHARDGGSRFIARNCGGLPSPCVGRDEQIASILSAIATRNTAHGYNGLVVTGDAGIGKSHLLHTVADLLSSDDTLLLRGDFAPSSLQSPFIALVDAIQRSLDVGSGPEDAAIAVTRLFRDLCIDSDSDLRLFLSLMQGTWIETDFRGHESARTGARIRDLLVTILCRIGKGGTTVLMLEDLHWADHAVHDLLDRILSMDVLEMPFLLLSDRSVNHVQRVSPKRVLHMPLPPLPPDDISQMILDRSTDLPLPGDAITRIVTTSEGNPLFACELLAMRRQCGTNWVGVPDSIARITLSRLGCLSVEAQHLLRAAAILGDPFPADLLALVSELLPGRIPDLLEEASGFVYPDTAASGVYRFRHNLIHAAIYESLLPSHRQAVHLRVALHLEAASAGQPQAISELLAHHFAKADEIEMAIVYLVMSGDRRMSLYALDDADGFFEAALQLSIRIGPRRTASILAKRMRVLELTCAFGEIIRIAKQHLAAIVGLGSSPEACAILNHYSHALLHGHHHGTAVIVAQRAQAMADQLAIPAAAAQAKMIILKALNVADNHEHLARAEQLGAEILALAQTEDDVYLACGACFALAVHHLQDGRLVAAEAKALHLMELGRRHQDARAESFGHWLKGWIAVQDLCFEAALRHADQSLQTAVTAADRLVGLGLKGVVLSLSGQPRDGLCMLREAHAVAFERGDMNLVSALDMPLGVALILAGAPRAGFAHLRTAIARRKRDGYAAMATFGHLVMGELYVRLANQDRKKRTASPTISLWDWLFLAPHVVFCRRRARKHLQIAARSQRWDAASAGRIRIHIAQATLKFSRHPSPAAACMLEQARDAASEAGLFGLAQAAADVLRRAQNSSR